MKSTSALLLITLFICPFVVYTQTTAAFNCVADNGTCPSGYAVTITPEG